MNTWLVPRCSIIFASDANWVLLFKLYFLISYCWCSKILVTVSLCGWILCTANLLNTMDSSDRLSVAFIWLSSRWLYRLQISFILTLSIFAQSISFSSLWYWSSSLSTSLYLCSHHHCCWLQNPPGHSIYSPPLSPQSHLQLSFSSVHLQALTQGFVISHNTLFQFSEFKSATSDDHLLGF